MGKKLNPQFHWLVEYEPSSFSLLTFQSKGEKYPYLSKVRVSNRPFGLGINNNHFHSR